MTERSAQCANCGRELDDSFELFERKPCPDCGSMQREHFASATATIQMLASVEAKVERGLNDIRLAVLGILVTIGLTVGLAVGFGLPSLLWGLVAGVASVAVACVAIRWGRPRRFLMEFTHRLTGH